MATEEDDTERHLQMSPQELQTAIQSGVQDALLGIFVFLVGMLMAAAFGFAGAQMIIQTPGIGWDLIGGLTVVLGVGTFVWAWKLV